MMPATSGSEDTIHEVDSEQRVQAAFDGSSFETDRPAATDVDQVAALPVEILTVVA